MSNYFIGLDMSLTATGFCCLRGTQITLQTVRTKPKDFNNDLERIGYITDEILRNIPAEVRMICIEDYYVPQSKAQFGSAINLVALGTLMRVKMYELGLPFYVIAPGQLKKFVTGSGNSQKSLIVREVFKRWNADAKDDNQADACVLAHLAQSLANKNHQLLKFQVDVIKKVTTTRPHYNC